VKWSIALLLALGPEAGFGQVADLSRQLREAPLEAETCYRVREFSYRRNEVRLFLTEGVIVFRKAVNGVRTGAVFLATEELEDGEILMIPPNRMERRSLASFTGAPNLNEHIRAAAFVFTDGTGEKWLEQIRASETARHSPERGVLVAEQWNEAMRNLSGSLETRILADLSNGGGPGRGFFFAAISGKTLGNFDVYFDPRNREELLIGQLGNDNGASRYNFWAHFEPKRAEARSMAAPAARIERFEIEAAVEEQLRFRARIRIHMQIGEREMRVLPMDVSPRLRLKAARWNGEEAVVFQREALRANLLRSGDSEMLLIEPKGVLRAGETGVLEVEQEGEVFFRAGNGVLYLAARTSWFPQIQFQAARFDVSFTHPKETTLVCPGEREEEVEGERKRTRCRVEQPLRLFGFNLGQFEASVVKRAGLEVEVYGNKELETALEPRPVAMVAPPAGPGPRRRIDGPALTVTAAPAPANPLSRLPEMAADLAAGLEYFQGLFGPPPLKRVVAAPIPGAFGQGFPGFLYLSTLAYLEDRLLPAVERAEWQGRYFREILEAHELAHQWWGNSVTFENYRDEWLSEALANYSALLFLEKRRGVKALELVLEDYKRRLLVEDKEKGTVESAGPVVFGMRLRMANPAAWQALTYGKSTWVLHMLRMRLGEESFLKLLGQLARDYAGRALATEDLRRAAAAYLPKDAPDRELVNFFETWVYGTGVPELTLTSSLKGTGGNRSVELRLRQEKVAADFEIDVPVEITLPRGRKIVRWMRTGSEEEVLEVKTGVAPVKVELDPRRMVLRR
jgi:hypothetical protein